MDFEHAQYLTLLSVSIGLDHISLMKLQLQCRYENRLKKVGISSVGMKIDTIGLDHMSLVQDS